ncbi:FAD-dependent oxidoreductase [Lichenicoccus sp.]|uniref:FAD-dependent oxidoreductase n=1 Tax=Lichenicoccus sp. TaxID=2781899 RepID=UPI003D0E58F2
MVPRVPVPQVLVRGAGVAGLVTSVTLAERGADVTLAEQGPRIGSGASWQAGGMLAPWCEAETAPVEIMLHGEAAIDWWLAHVPDAVRAGSLVLAPARDQGELLRFARRTDGHEWLDAEAIAALEPALIGRFGRALLYPREAHLDPRAALAALAARLQATGGSLQLDAGDYDRAAFTHVVDCRGFAARATVAALRGVRGEMLLLRCPDFALRRPVRLLHPRHPVYLVPRADHVFMLGATMVESEQQGGITARAAMELLGAAYTLHPALAEAEIIETGAGLRPSYPDNMPRVRVQEDGTISVNGMHRHGYLLAPVLAAEVAGILGLQASLGLHT